MSNDDDMCVIDDNEEFSECDIKYKSLMPDNIEVLAFKSLFLFYLGKITLTPLRIL
jgi:hypothetical protein